MLLEALKHWDQRVLRVLRKRSQSSKQCGSP
jgi:hypothetical protein